MSPRALTMWPRGQLERIAIVLVAVGGGEGAAGC